MPSKPSSSKAHIVYKSRSHLFHKYDFLNSSSAIIATTPFLTITPTATSANSYSTSNHRSTNDYSVDIQTHNYTAYHISDDYANYDNITAQYTTISDPNINITGIIFFSQLLD